MKLFRMGSLKQGMRERMVSPKFLNLFEIVFELGLDFMERLTCVRLKYFRNGRKTRATSDLLLNFMNFCQPDPDKQKDINLVDDLSI